MKRRGQRTTQRPRNNPTYFQSASPLSASPPPRSAQSQSGDSDHRTPKGANIVHGRIRNHIILYANMKLQPALEANIYAAEDGGCVIVFDMQIQREGVKEKYFESADETEFLLCFHIVALNEGKGRSCI